MSGALRSQDATISEPLAPEVLQAPSLGVPTEGTGVLRAIHDSNLQQFHGEFASFHEGYVRHYIALADTKAGLSFGIASAILAHQLTSVEVRSLLVQPTCSVAFLILAASTLLLLVSAIFSFFVIAPRLASPSNEGVVFFGAVAKRSDADTYVTDLARLSENQIVEARLRHCFDVSCVCSVKYDFLKKAIWSGFFGLVGPLYLLLFG